eukprot:gene12950-8806_t
MSKELPADAADPNRWGVLILFSVYSCSNAIQWVTFASVATSVKEFFDLTTYELNMLSMVYMIVFVVGAFFTCTTFERWGVRKGVLIGSGLNALGSVLKFAPGLQYPSYLTMIIPQTLNSLAQLFVLSTPPLIAAQYFPADRRAFATAVAATANSLGNAIALLVPPLIVKEPKVHQFQILFGMEMALCVGIFLAVVAFLKPPQFSAPSTALLHAKPEGRRRQESVHGSPSALGKQLRAATYSSVEEVGRPTLLQRLVRTEQVIVFAEVWATWMALFRCRDFVFLLVAFSIGMGSIWTFASVLAQISGPVGVSEVLAGISGAGNIVVGTAMAYVVGMWVDRHRKYKIPVVVCFAGSVVVCVAYILVMAKGPANTRMMDGLCLFVYIFAGLFQNTAIPICFEFAMEISYPHQESAPGALMMAGANLSSAIMVLVASAIMGNGTAEKSAAIYVVIMITALCAVGLVFSILPRETLHRHEAELLAQQDDLEPGPISVEEEKHTACEEAEIRRE